MNEAKIKAMGDLAFKKVFGAIGNEEIVAGLVNDFFGFTPADVRITNPYDIKVYEQILRESGGDYSVLKQTLNDVGAEFSSGDFLAEAQIKKQGFFGARSLYYAFSRFCGNYDRNGNAYEDLRNVYALNILEESYFKNDGQAVRVFRLFDDCANIHIDKDYLAIGYFEISKTGLRNQNQHYWRMYFRGEKLPADAPGYIRRAERLIEVVNLGKEERRMISLQEKYEADQNAYFKEARMEGLKKGREEGLEQGLEQGLVKGLEQGLEQGLVKGLEQGLVKGLEQGRAEGTKERSIEIARNLKNEGSEKALIAKVSGLTEKEIDSL